MISSESRACRVWAVVGIMLAVLAVPSALAEDSPCQVAKSIGSTGYETGQFGWALDAVEDVIVVGSPYSDDIRHQAGQALVFRRVEGIWEEEVGLAPPSLMLGELFGFSVSLDRISDGRRVVLGAPGRTCSVGPPICGAAFVFDDLGGGLWSLISELGPDTRTSEQSFGTSVAVEGDRVAVGAPEASGGLGEVYVFEFDGLSWQERAKLVPQGSTGWFGQSVVLSGDFLFIGASRDTEAGSGAGAVFIFKRDEFGVWSQVQKLTASGGGTTDYLGYSLAVSGNVLLVGAPYGDPGPGAAYVFEFDGELVRWVETQRLQPSVPELARFFGKSVSMFGNLAAIGDNGNSGDDRGGVYLFDAGTWSECARVLPSPRVSFDEFGAPAVLLSDSVIVGAYADSNEHGDFAGAFYVFLRGKVLAGNVNTGDGSLPADVVLVNGNAGNRCKVVGVQSGVSSTISIERAPQGNGAYAFWLYDFRRYAGAPIQYLKNGTTYDLGSGVKALPINNSVTPGSVPCPLTFPIGWTSQSLGSGAAGTFCINSQPGFPRAPTSFNVIFPPGNFIVGGLVTDQNSINSPALNVSIANWIFVRSR